MPESSQLFSGSRERSSRFPYLAQLNSQSSRQSNHRSLGDVEALYDTIVMLEKSHVPGPATLIWHNQYIGQGAQFVVYRQTVAWTHGGHTFSQVVAAKQPKFDLDPAKRLDMADGKARQHLDNIRLEVRSLTSPRLRRHPNIVRLLAWGYGINTLHHPLSLIMELAVSDLGKVLAGDQVVRASRWVTYMLCSDIAAGLDAIHLDGLVHGDLKPQNILIFGGKRRLVAKISDFGLSIAGLEADESNPDPRARLGGTFGWQAPEVEKGELLTAIGLEKADTYSFGLVAWSAFFGFGEAPPRLSANERREFLLSRYEEPGSPANSHLLSVARAAFPILLHDNPSERSRDLEELLQLDEHTQTARQGVVQLIHQNNWDAPDDASTREESEDDANSVVAFDTIVGNLPETGETRFESKEGEAAIYPWEIPCLPAQLLTRLLTSFRDGDPTISPDITFAIFLFESCYLGKAFPVPKQVHMDLLIAAATAKSDRAMAAVSPVFAFFGEGPPAMILEWLKIAISKGSLSARYDAAQRDLDTLANGLENFRRDGGYASYYCIQLESDSIFKIASHGSLQDLRRIRSCGRATDVNERTSGGETALYLACTRGSWDIAAELLSHGADASVSCTSFGISCLHWLFTFDSGVQRKAAKALISAGADINAVLTDPVPFPHYPFSLPSGSPLHWAVVVGSYCTIEVLIDLGADLYVRDGSDPYRYDDRVRIQGQFGGPNQIPFSVPPTRTAGISALDCAAMDREPFIFEYLESIGKIVDMNAADEEGFTVAHRLSAAPLRITRTGTQFSSLPFRGSPHLQRDKLRRTVRAIQSLGGNLDQLTTPSPDPSIQPLQSLTPLTAAILASQPDLVAALLDHGASVHAENDQQNTAIHIFGEGDTPAGLEITRLLIAAGADIHQKDRHGNTPLCIAATGGKLYVFELLLSKGGFDLSETLSDPLALAQRGRGLFALLARGGPPFDESRDVKVAELLEKYVLAGHGVDAEETRRRIFSHRDRDGRVLLHFFASEQMRRSVRLLIQHGVEVNPVSAEFKSRSVDGKLERRKVEFRYTPLNLAVRARDRVTEHVGNWTLAEVDDLYARADAVIAVLEEAGGARAEDLAGEGGGFPDLGGLDKVSLD